MNGLLWGVCTFLMCIVVLPVYLIVRNSKKDKGEIQLHCPSLNDEQQSGQVAKKGKVRWYQNHQIMKRLFSPKLFTVLYLSLVASR